MSAGARIFWPAAASAVLVIAGCSSWKPEEPSIAGWPLGPETPCDITGALAEPKYDRVAIAANSARFEAVDIKDVRCYGEGSYLRDGERFLMTRSGGVTIAVFTLADGSQRAIGVACSADCRTVGPPNGPGG
jgi:hypothetical protein